MSGGSILRRIGAVALLLVAALGAAVPAPAAAQTSASAYTTGYRWDGERRIVGVIKPSPSGTTAPFLATRYTYNADGLLTKQEDGRLAAWQGHSVLPANWTGFTVHNTIEFAYDPGGRRIKETVKGDNGVAVSVKQISYDPAGRVECTAVRMNPANFPTLPASACTQGAQGGNGPDRITRNLYDAAGAVAQVREAVGTTANGMAVDTGSNGTAEVTYTYTANGQIRYVIDAAGNRAEKRYDFHDRQQYWVFPSTTKPAAFNGSTPATADATAGALNESDYEAYSYDASGNRTSLRKRDGSVLTYQYDALNRMSRKVVPNRVGLADAHEHDVVYSYDLRGLQTAATFKDTAETSVGSVTNQYDGFGRLDYTDAWMAGDAVRRLDYSYDANGNRTRITHPGAGAPYFAYAYDGLSRLQTISENATWLMTFKYNTRGSLGELQRDRATSYWTPDNAGRLDVLAHYPTSPSANVSWDFDRNAASQITSVLRNNDSYAWTAYANGGRNYTTNGLNQYTAAGTAAFCYDANGNLAADGSYVYLYDVENRLVEMRVQGTGNANCLALSYAGALRAQLRYDPLGRLYEAYDPSSGSLRRLLYDGDALVAEYGVNSNDPPLRRFVHGSDAKADDPLLWYEGGGVGESARRHLLADHQGSIVGVLDGVGSPLNNKFNTYDEYGLPGQGNQGRFQYTGQAWMPELGMYYYKARMYSPTLGRFMQTDPIGYDDQFNLYAYVGNDPVNLTDPTGEQGEHAADTADLVRYLAARRSADTPQELEKLAMQYRTHFNAVGNHVGASLTNIDLHVATQGLMQLYDGGIVPTRSELVDFAEAQGWTASQTESGPLVYSDQNGVARLTIKDGSPRTPGSEGPHISYRDADNRRRDPVTGELVSRRSEGNHRPFEPDGSTGVPSRDRFDSRKPCAGSRVCE